MTLSLPAFWPRGLPATITPPATTLVENLVIAARRYPTKPALVFYDNVVTFGQMLSQATRIAGFLQKRLRVRAGDRVLLFAQNCPQFIATYHAVHLAGAVVVLVNAMTKTAELRHQAETVGARAIVAASELMPQVQPLLGSVLDHVLQIRYADAIADPANPSLPQSLLGAPDAEPHPLATSWVEAMQSGCALDPVPTGPDDGALIAFTSGTTGKPKGCFHTHGSVMASTVGSALWRGCLPESVFLGLAPVFHLLGLQAAVNIPTYLGATTVLMSRWDANTAVRCVARYGVTHWTAPPPMLTDLLMAPEATKDALRSLKLVNGGGGPLPESIQTRLRDELDVKMMEGWGMTEIAGMGTLNPLDRCKPQCIGIATFGVRLRLRDPETGREVEKGQVGELVMRGAQLLKGYWGDPEATQAAFVDMDGEPYFRTGDLGRQDEDGYFYIVDRLKRMIVVSGYKVWPAEVESRLYQHPSVQEACVFGMPDSRTGEQVWAAVALRPTHRSGNSEQDIMDWCRNEMANYKAPRRIVFVDSIPRLGTGKFDWRVLREQMLKQLQTGTAGTSA